VFACHDAMALTDARSVGPSKMPQPREVADPSWTHLNSCPERLTPRSRTVVALASTRWLPTTRSESPAAEGAGTGLGDVVAEAIGAAGLGGGAASGMGGTGGSDDLAGAASAIGATGLGGGAVSTAGPASEPDPTASGPIAGALGEPASPVPEAAGTLGDV
jgi:hypothetical protein